MKRSLPRKTTATRRWRTSWRSWHAAHKKPGGANYCLVPDRAEAIRQAVRLAGPGDTVLLAGKGPEDTLERGDVTLPWNEVEQARAALAELGAAGERGEGPIGLLACANWLSCAGSALNSF